jgi:hypothetical protein
VNGPAAWPTRRSLALVWAGAALGFAVLLVAADHARGQLDDPDPARQRPGVVDTGALPAPAPELVDGIPTTGRRAVVFFERPGGLERLCRALAGSTLGQQADVVVVVSAQGAPCEGRTGLVVDPAASYARRVGLDVPRDGGPPVGYAVVDSRRRIRYRTLDPHMAKGLGEVATILAAIR